MRFLNPDEILLRLVSLARMENHRLGLTLIVEQQEARRHSAGAALRESTSRTHPRSPSNPPIVQQVKAGTYYWCRCRASKAQPFCDGSHKGSHFAPLKHDVAEPRTGA